MTRRALAALACTLMLPHAAPAAEGTAAPTAPCRIPGLPHDVQCGTVQRPLDPSRPDGTLIGIRYARVPALARSKHDIPIFLIAGGPGQSAIDIAPAVMPLFQRLNHRRDVVFVDQRGTGGSAPLNCPDERHRPLAEQADIGRAVEALERCRRDLQQLPHGDLRHYTTTIAMADLDAVRAALGAGRIDLVAASYGTRAALEYVRQFPARVRRMVLDGAAPADMALPASQSPDAEAAMQALLASCEQEPACRQAHPALRADWSALLGNLPRETQAAHPLTGRRESFTLTREMLLQAVRRALYVPSWASALPPAIADASQGRLEGLLGLAAMPAGPGGTEPAMGMHFSVICAEDVPRLAASADAPGATFGDGFARLYERVCAQWPRGDVPAAFYTLPASPATTLVLSGGLDPATPPRHGERVAWALGPNARHVVVPNAGHGVMAAGCMPDVLHRFLSADGEADALAVDVSCATRIPRPTPFRPVTLEARP